MYYVQNREGKRESYIYITNFCKIVTIVTNIFNHHSKYKKEEQQ